VALEGKILVGGGGGNSTWRAKQRAPHDNAFKSLLTHGGWEKGGRLLMGGICGGARGKGTPIIYPNIENGIARMCGKTVQGNHSGGISEKENLVHDQARKS